MKTIVVRAIETALINLCEKKDFDKITVREICESCEISKPTFYKYFVDKYDVAARIYLRDALINDDNDTYFSEEEIRKALTNIAANKRFYLKALSSKGQNCLLSFLAENTIQSLTQYAISKSDHCLTDEEIYLLKFFTYGWVLSFHDWIRGDSIYSIDQLAHLQRKALPEFLCKLSDR